LLALETGKRRMAVALAQFKDSSMKMWPVIE
jgi:hypothetical protein